MTALHAQTLAEVREQDEGFCLALESVADMTRSLFDLPPSREPTAGEVAAADACVVEFHAERGWYGRDRSHDVIARAIAKARVEERERCAAHCLSVRNAILGDVDPGDGQTAVDARARAGALRSIAIELRGLK